MPDATHLDTDLSAALSDVSYAAPTSATPGDLIHFTIVNAELRQFQDFNDKARMNTRVVLRVKEDPRQVKLGKGSGARILAAFGSKTVGLVGKSIKGIVTALPSGKGVFVEWYPKAEATK